MGDPFYYLWRLQTPGICIKKFIEIFMVMKRGDVIWGNLEVLNNEMHAFICELTTRDLFDDVTIILHPEFGRTQFRGTNSIVPTISYEQCFASIFRWIGLSMDDAIESLFYPRGSFQNSLPLYGYSEPMN